MIAYTEASARPIPFTDNLYLVKFAYSLYTKKYVHIETVESEGFVGSSGHGEIKAIICAFLNYPELTHIYSDYANVLRKISACLEKDNFKEHCLEHSLVLYFKILGKKANLLFEKLHQLDSKKQDAHWKRHNELHCRLKASGKETVTRWQQPVNTSVLV